MAAKGSKFVAQNRRPRVQIQYEVDTGNAVKMVELPFLCGVMSDLSGKSEVEKKDISEREFIEFDAENLDSRMKAIKPAVKFQVDDKISGEEGKQLSVDMTFESIDDFRPDRIAQRHPVLQKLYEQRKLLDNLLSMIDGKPDAEKLIMEAMKSEELLKSLAADSGEES